VRVSKIYDTEANLLNFMHLLNFMQTSKRAFAFIFCRLDTSAVIFSTWQVNKVRIFVFVLPDYILHKLGELKMHVNYGCTFVGFGWILAKHSLANSKRPPHAFLIPRHDSACFQNAHDSLPHCVHKEMWRRDTVELDWFEQQIRRLKHAHFVF
jgi:hypothetical protein